MEPLCKLVLHEIVHGSVSPYLRLSSCHSRQGKKRRRRPTQLTLPSKACETISTKKSLEVEGDPLASARRSNLEPRATHESLRSPHPARPWLRGAHASRSCEVEM